jgi:hypothetical protein
MNQQRDNSVVGSVPFVDGVTRDVYEDGDGQQWVVGYKGGKVGGQKAPAFLVSAPGRRLMSFSASSGASLMGSPLVSQSSQLSLA